MQYLPRYSAEQIRRHEVRPGITGWAQVNGRNGISWDDKFSLDVWYVDNRSLLLDIRIIFMTIAAVLARKDVTAAGEATMPEFMGGHNSN
jgi:lipopolysaccharide/colanic/teichoic acid biosynthesis glycosyltransferase